MVILKAANAAGTALRQFTDWGFDLLKYDWCSYGNVVQGKQDLDTFKKPYILMGGILKHEKRDITLNLCQSSRADRTE